MKTDHETNVLSMKDKRHLFLNNIAYAIHRTLWPDKAWQDEKNKQRLIKALVAVHNQPPSLVGVTIDDWKEK